MRFPGWIAGRAPTGRTGPRGFHHRLFGWDGSPVERRLGFATGCYGTDLAGDGETLGWPAPQGSDAPPSTLTASDSGSA